MEAAVKPSTQHKVECTDVSAVVSIPLSTLSRSPRLVMSFSSVQRKILHLDPVVDRIPLHTPLDLVILRNAVIRGPKSVTHKK